ncbi:nitroreductase/quinone reductase family protein [Microbacterium sp. ASV49]|uniref:Nitroreductase/quinone reductase family protein n=1 Tax=Microbacterium candidum TaxID=3041922 RepID=A0ABT7MWP0_9MICO|nr:nitroreductase/quinone reductase family protein [Microbacterium sp. ASV49]MDL9978860.1 nitroreductase/quinone reductase family protein [Microbacterium sp. ASV49]
MTFTTPDGTYGITMKPNRLMRWFMHRQTSAIRRGKQGKMMGFAVLALITTGRKSGKTYETPMGYWEEPAGTWVICASAAGAAKHPAWYRNLAAAPDSAHIVIAGEEIAVSAEELHGTERDAAWKRIIDEAPRFAGYTEKTDRELPVIRLTRRSN